MPTIKQQVAAKKISENLRKPKGKRKTLGKILKEAGYSKSMQKAPTQVTASPTFRELLRKAIPDDMVIKLQSDLMNAADFKTCTADPDLSDSEIREIIEESPGFKVLKILRYKVGVKKKKREEVKVYYQFPDQLIRKGAVDMFYKLDNKYPKDKEETDANSAIKGYLDKLSKILP